MRKAILVIDGDELICKEIEALFHGRTTEVQCARTIEEGLKWFFASQYCLTIVDILMLDACGLSLLNIMRRSKNTPILALASGGECIDKVSVLNNGADGFLMKPFQKAECMAVVDALIRRHTQFEDPYGDIYPLEFGRTMIIEPRYRLVTLDGQTLDLTRKEYDILYLLAKRPYQVFTRSQIYDCLWNMESYFNTDDAVRFHIQNLRRKLRRALGGVCNCVETVWGVGYRFNPEMLKSNKDTHR